MNKLLCISIMCLLVSISLVSANLIIQEPEFAQEFAFDNTPTISWDGCSEDSYLLQIATDAFFDAIVFQQTVSSSSYELEVELDPSKYFIRVNAIDGEGEFSCVSPTSEFEIKEVSPLSFFFDESQYESDSILRIEMNGPLDARVDIEITGNNFFLPILLEDLSEPDFELELSSGEYRFDATSTYADGELTASQTIRLGTIIKEETQDDDEEDIEDTIHNLTIFVKEFDGEYLEEMDIRIENGTNVSLETDENGSASILLSTGEYELFFEDDDFVDDDEEIFIDEDRNFTFYVISDEFDDAEDEDNETQEEESSSVIAAIDFEELEKDAYATSFVPLVFSLEGDASRCQVLTKNPGEPGYAILQTVLSPGASNEVILTELEPGDIQVRIRCLLDDDEALISQTRTITVIDIDSEKINIEQARDEAQETLTKINNFPLSFKQIFIDDVVKLENYVSRATELIKKASTSTDIIAVRDEMRELNEESTENFLKTIVVNNTKNIISYGTLDDVDIVIEHLDLAKSPKQLLDEQEQFAIKTNYNFVTLTYASGLILKQTFVSNQVLTVQGIDYNIAYEEYYVMPNFLTSRLVPSNDVVVKEYDDGALVRILNNASALIFDGWLDETSLVKTIILADSVGSSPTGFVTASSSTPTWRIPLISFVVVLLLAGLFFNPYFSVMNMFEKGSMSYFTTKVHECIDASLAQEHQKVIQLIPKVLDIHEKLSKDDQVQANAIIDQVREMFYDSTYQLTLRKISSKDPTRWTYDELEIAIKDFYGSYAKLSPAKQRAYLPYYNQMLHYCQELLSKVKK